MEVRVAQLSCPRSRYRANPRPTRNVSARIWTKGPVTPSFGGVTAVSKSRTETRGTALPDEQSMQSMHTKEPAHSMEARLSMNGHEEVRPMSALSKLMSRG